MAAEVVLGALIEVTISNLISIVREQVNLIAGLGDELEKLQDTLTMIQGVLEDADQRQLTDKAVSRWLLRLRDLTYQANDVLDELAYENLRREVESQTQQVRNLFGFPNLVAFRRKVAQKIKAINFSLRNINSQAAELGLQQRLNNAVPVSASSPETHSFLGETKRVGREPDISRVVNLLLGPPTNQQDFSVVSIVGMAGLGKTTLAKLVYDDDLVKRHFDVRVWVCVSDDFDVKRILRNMLEHLGYHPKASQSKEGILSELKYAFKRKNNFLLILDDVWNEDVSLWEDFRTCLFSIDKSIGSRIVVTTRSEKVALKMDTLPNHIHHLKTLEDEECWSIMKERVTRTSPVLPEFEIIGRKIAEKCGGIPLVANVIGGSMCGNMNVEGWLSIQQSSLWGSLEDNEGILRTLKLSFDRLGSACLKKCFLYCSIFPKDSCINKDKLIQLWMAAGYLESSEGRKMSMEDIGGQFFNALLSNSFFQDVERDVLGNIATIKMHDLIHDLAVSLSKSEALVLDSNSLHAISHIRHLSIISSNIQLPAIPRGVGQNLHSLVSTVNIFQHMSVRFKRLRSLDLSEANVSELPGSIGRMKHLRYFNISGTEIKSIPNSFSKLYNLQSFIFLKCHLTKLPRRMKNLVKLRHLCFDDDKLILPRDIGCLTGLQTLPIFVVDEERGCGIEVLGHFSELQGELCVCRLDRVKSKEEANKAKLQYKSKLYKIEFRWHGLEASQTSHEDVLEGLQPHPNLKSLTIWKYQGNNFPPWLSTGVCDSRFLLENLMKLELVCCENSVELPSLGQLPKLEILRIQSLRNVKSIESTFYYNAQWNNGFGQVSTLFPKLKIFELSRMTGLEEWVDASLQGLTAFPLLEELVIQSCYNLKSVPIVSNLPSLLRLEISFCDELCHIGDGLSKSKYLSELQIWQCPNLTPISSIDGLSFLKVLKLGGCVKMNCLPSGLQSCTSLQRLEIVECPNMTGSLECLGELSFLSFLAIKQCKQLRLADDSFSRLMRLKALSVGGFSEELEEFHPCLNSIHHLHASLEALQLHGWENLKSMPHQLQHLTALKELLISGFGDMEALPEWLGNLSSLRQLEVLSCKNLKYLPSQEAIRRLSNLRNLFIANCPELQDRCTRETGPEWPKISHIPDFDIGPHDYKSLLIRGLRLLE